jgi:integrase
MAILITETAIAAAARRAAVEKKRVEIADKGHAGLRLRISPSGGKSWALACRDGEGRMRRFPLGAMPKMGLKEARKAADAMRVAVRGGADPVAEGRRKRAIGRDAKENIGTLAALVELYGKKRGQTLKSWTDCKRRIDSVFAKQLKRPVATMRRADLQFEADNWPSAQSAAAAVRYIRPVLKWAAAGGREYVARDLSDLTPPATVGRRERVLSREELARLVPVLAASDRPYGRAMWLMLLTACRREEAGAACWRDVDFDAGTWTILETKNGRKHVVPLSRQAAALLSGIKPRAAKPDELIFATAGGLRLGNWDKGTKTVQTASKTDGWTRHDLRRTAATLLGELGEPPHVIEAALNHAAVHSQLAATYNQSRYRPEVAAALQRLADALDGIAAGGAEVVPMHRRRAAKRESGAA